MAGLVPAIHVFAAAEKENVDARHRRQVYAVCASLTALPGMTSSDYSVPASPACVTTLPQRAISEAMKRCSSSGEEPPPGIMPSLMICC
jgi:hypothetical protein